MKKSIFCFALLIGAASPAYAIPVLWTVNTGGPVTGSFVFDADVGGPTGYSSINLVETNFGDTYTGAAQGGSGASTLNLVSNNFLDTMSLVFSTPLTNAGGGVVVTATVGCTSLCFYDPNPYTVEGRTLGIAVAVPEPGTFGLLALGLICLGFARRKAV